MVTLLGQNVNSYGADLIVGEKNVQVMRDIDKTYFEASKKRLWIKEKVSIEEIVLEKINYIKNFTINSLNELKFEFNY